MSTDQSYAKLKLFALNSNLPLAEKNCATGWNSTR
jgi:hypothetical protein